MIKFILGLRGIKLFEIRLERDIVVLRGDQDDAPSELLRGSVVLCLSESLNLKDIQLQLVGTSRLIYPDQGLNKPARDRVLRQASQFCSKSMVLLDLEQQYSRTLPAGDHEYPFEIVIPGDAPESVEGMDDSWVVYKLKATIGRGKLAVNREAKKHVRIVRTIPQTYLELMFERRLDNIWPEKARYAIVIPRTAFALGTFVPVEVKFVPLIKGLRLTQIYIALKERQEYTILTRTTSWERVVATTDLEIQEEIKLLNEEGEEGWLIHDALYLPVSLKNCIQDVDALGIRIRHSMQFELYFVDSHGMTSQISAALGVQVFIAHDSVLDESNELVNRPALDEFIMQNVLDPPPPLYGNHHLDDIWSDISVSGYITPTTVTLEESTPSLSQEGSGAISNVTSLGTRSHSLPGGFSTQLLQERLSILSSAGTGSTHRRRSQPDNSVLGNVGRSPPGEEATPQQSPVQVAVGFDWVAPHSRASRRPERGVFRPEHSEFGVHSPNRVPSYNTAMRSSTSTLASRNHLPTYNDATRSRSVSLLQLPRITSETSISGRRNRLLQLPSLPWSR